MAAHHQDEAKTGVQPARTETMPFWDPTHWENRIGRLSRKQDWFDALIDIDEEARRRLGYADLPEILRAPLSAPAPPLAVALYAIYAYVLDHDNTLELDKALRTAPFDAAISLNIAPRGIHLTPDIAVAFGTETGVIIEDGAARVVLVEERRLPRDELAQLLQDKAAFAEAVRSGRLRKWHTGWNGSNMTQREFVVHATSPAHLDRLTGFLAARVGAAHRLPGSGELRPPLNARHVRCPNTDAGACNEHPPAPLVR